MDPMEQKRKDLEKLLTEIQAHQDEFKDGKVPDQVAATAMDAKAEEAMTLQAELDAIDKRAQKFQDVLGRGNFPGLPPDNQPGPTKVEKAGDDVIGYLTLGQYALAQGGLKTWSDLGRPKSNMRIAEVPTLLRGKRQEEVFVPVTRKSLAQFKESKAVPTFFGGVIEPQRLTDLVRVTEHDALKLRDILNISPTSSNAVEWVRLVNYTRAADPTAHGALKPESDLTLDTQTSPVRTIPVWMPVQDQQLDDLPQLQNIINTELLYDIEKRIEELVCWGTGVGQEFLGFFVDPLIWSCGQMDLAGATRVVAGDTLIDIIRRGITDVRVAGYSPNGVLVHPYDWEDIQLEKATDNQYVYVIVTEAGVSRLWGVPVVETEACQDFSGNAIEERSLLVGDFTRGATLYDRMQSQISVGYIDDQFIRNMRTILAEWRGAWAIRRPGAFRDYVTQAAVES